MKKQNLQVTANNRAVMMWVISTVQNKERQVYGVYTEMSEASKADKFLQGQGFETSYLETCLEFGYDYDREDEY